MEKIENVREYICEKSEQEEDISYKAFESEEEGIDCYGIELKNCEFKNCIYQNSKFVKTSFSNVWI